MTLIVKYIDGEIKNYYGIAYINYENGHLYFFGNEEHKRIPLVDVKSFVFGG